MSISTTTLEKSEQKTINNGFYRRHYGAEQAVYINRLRLTKIDFVACDA